MVSEFVWAKKDFVKYVIHIFCILVTLKNLHVANILMRKEAHKWTLFTLYVCQVSHVLFNRL